MENICGKKVKVRLSQECLSCIPVCLFDECGIVIGVADGLLVIEKESGELITSPIDRVQILE